MTSRPKPTDRESLYNEVWTDPISVVAERYGMSDVGLAKACKRLSVPYPRRGYWASVRAGHAVRKVPLPERRPNARFQLGPTPLTEPELALRTTVKEAVAETRRVLDTTLPVLTDGTDVHPLVKAAGVRLRRKSGWDHRAGLRSAPTEVLNISVTEGSIDRALRIADSLLKSITVLGLTVEVREDKGASYLVGRGTRLELSISEHVARSKHVLTESEERARKRYFDAHISRQVPYPITPEFDWTPSGRLTISVGGYPKRCWNDTDRTPLERRWSDIMAGIVALAETTREREEESRRRQQRHDEAVARYHADMRLRNHEQEQYRSLIREAAEFRRANNLRTYIAAVEQRAVRDGTSTPEDHEWIEWARAKADWLDPLIDVSDPILDAPEPKFPNYWS